jgi:hypothetical protein
MIDFSSLGDDPDAAYNTLEALQERLGEEPLDDWRCAGILGDTGSSRFLSYVTEGHGTIEIERSDRRECAVTVSSRDGQTDPIHVDFDDVATIAQLMDVYNQGHLDGYTAADTEDSNE